MTFAFRIFRLSRGAVGLMVAMTLSAWLMWMTPRWAERVTLSYSRRQATKLAGWDRPMYRWDGPRGLGPRANRSPFPVEEFLPTSGSTSLLGERNDYQPLVSIITPSFNQAPYLPATLASVANQTYPHIEHIVMDGGSSDGSVEILEDWSKIHPIRWRSEPDRGQAAAIQAGVELASGEIVGWLNSDDVYLDPEAISDAVRALGNGAAAVSGAGWYITPSGERLRHIPVFPDRLDFATLRHVDWVLQPATFVRREVFLQFPLDTQLHFAFDWDFFIRLSRAVRIVPLERDIAGYRLHGTGKTETGGPRRRHELMEVASRYNHRLSPGYLLLFALSEAEELGERFPEPLRYIARGLATRIAVLSNIVADGRGIQH